MVRLVEKGAAHPVEQEVDPVGQEVAPLAAQGLSIP